ncbi:mitochondrial thiamine pyrophosphate transporter [Rhizophlyctis rosea]|uniref:Mitochondrial thiamine pyrophosphate carrier 1 n=1 Tax=Rhizophlyctis rosea TaxID=64517 RepID=A0AAD5S9G7_9FUNG|nr:mitochondrial thiamine pyrophosphate transporter [Rhizophlyctis rosea]
MFVSLSKNTEKALKLINFTPAPDQKKVANVSSLQNAASGAIAGMISRFFIAPLDIVKIRFQLQPDTLRGTIPRRQDSKYRGIIQSARLIAREEGIRGLWKGNLSAEYLYLTYGAVQFYTYNESGRLIASLVCYLVSRWDLRANTEQNVQDNVIAPHKVPDSIKTFLAGAIAGGTATVITFPFDLLRTRFAAQGEPKVYTGIIQAIRLITRNEGIAGFYRGVGPSVAAIIPQMGIVFESYSIFKKGGKRLMKTPIGKTVNEYVNGIDNFVAGGLAGMAGKTAVMPFDVVRKRLQIQGPDRNAYSVGAVPSYSGTFNCVRQIIRQEGFLALYKGLVPALLKAAPASAITFLVFEKCQKAFSRMNNRKASA